MQTMTRVIVLRAVPGPNGTLQRPRRVTVHRLGEGLGRIEEAPDARRKDGRLVVAALPDVWEIEAGRRTGSHRVDPGPSYAFHAPALSRARGTATSGLAVELGREFEYLRARGARRSLRTVAGEERDAWEVVDGGHEVTLMADPGTERPRRLTVVREGRTVLELQYLAYERGLSPELDLFTPLPADS